MYRVALWLLNWFHRCPMPGDHLYKQAMDTSDDLITKFRENHRDPIREIVADILTNRHNAPYVASVYETVQEVNAPLKQHMDGRGGKS